ncbi:xylan 1,4-beta-xylosidase [Gracilimonas mengyeensis]|uniref:Beta-glucosidase n=1 Tax=Gracilimonas mengyeensis TaxID=1302730 RepID=A0A521AYG7_9BACT|nr:xylan 1,4-beta-xylosidase [Gracilimonas mengyeensis]SMO39887.1 beta-glucosidase [Gracilimonas mengyeensis]
MKHLTIFTILVFLSSISAAQDLSESNASKTKQNYPFQNPELSSEERAEDLISRLTLEEKASLLQDQSPAIPRLGIPKFNWWSEALHGFANNDSVTVFPQNIGMAASFDDELVYEIFSATSDEARAKYNQARMRGEENRRFLSLSVWTPNVNIFRDPRWGRGQETYGEDPYLMTRMGVNVVKGLQGPEDEKYLKLLAGAKHYAVHSGPEWSRHSINLTDVDPRELYETYLPAFKALVEDANVRQVMCAYNRLDDNPLCGSERMLEEILREAWDFEYLVVADCGAVHDFYTTHDVSTDPVHAAARAVRAGTDLECDWENYTYKTLPEAVNRHLIREQDVDQALKRVLVGRFDLGDFDDDSMVKWAQIPPSILNNAEHRALALEMARKSMTLLQNKNDVLPLSKDIDKVAVLGSNADNEVMLWGNYNGTPVRTITILDGIKSKLSEDQIYYSQAIDLVEDKVLESYFDGLSFEGEKGFKATYWNTPDWSGEPVNTARVVNPMKLTVAGQHQFAPGVALDGFSAKYEGEYTAKEDGKLVFRFGATGFFELFVNGESLEQYTNWRTLPSRATYPVEAGETFDIEIHYAQRENWQANLEFNFGKELDVTYDEIIENLDGIETVIYVGGLSTLLEGEEMPVNYPGFKSGDRTNIELPAVQREFLKALKAAGKTVIYVNNSGSAIALTPETESADAILQAWYAGESGGQAVADVLFGDYNPGGKLPVTFYKHSDQLPDIEDYSMKGRTYRYLESEEALFPFGFGLSYTTFDIGEAEASKTSITPDETVWLTIPVSNIGDMAGTEIVQVYVRKVDDVEGPIKTLKGFKRVELNPGKSTDAVIELPPTSFEFYDWEQRKMAITPGRYKIFYGNSSDQKDLKEIIVEIL